jgi:hypothetical protein
MFKKDLITGWILLLVIGIFLTTPAVGQTIYVDVNATGANNGSSWADAYNYLQDAQADATSGDEIWVAQGTYKPDRGGGKTLGDRNATFQLINGVALYGGFPSGTDSNWTDRDPNVHITILSGDLNANDVAVKDTGDLYVEPSRAENSYHVVTGSTTNETAIIDGFTITAGYANSYPGNDGGGMYNMYGNPTIMNCSFIGNCSSSEGGGMYNEPSSPTIMNCSFIGNCSSEGGGMHNAGELTGTGRSSPIVTNCVFMNNLSIFHGGGMYNEFLCSPTLTNCNFTENRTKYGDGGAIHNSDIGFPMLINCRFSGNVAGVWGKDLTSGGAIYNQWANPRIINCTFKANSAYFGGAICNSFNVSRTIINCTFSGNTSDGDGGVLYNTNRASTTFINCILWGNCSPRGPQIDVYSGSIDLFYCIVQGGEQAIYKIEENLPTVNWNEGNIDANPRPTPDGHLSAASPCIDAGTGTGAPATDVDNEPRPYGSEVDIGSDEFIDLDGNGLPDWWEQKYFGDSNIAEPNADPDCDWLTNLEEYKLYSSDPNKPPYYVNAINGNDSFDGLVSIPIGGKGGPKKTIQAGIDVASDGDTVLVAAGTYTGPNNVDLDFKGKSIVLLAPDSPNDTIIDCNNSGRGFYFHSVETPATAVVGFTITNGLADYGGAIRCEQSNPQIRNCVITGNTSTVKGGGIYCYLSMPTLADCNISNNGSEGVWGEFGGARIEGIVELSGNNWVGSDIMLYGDGVLLINSTVTLDLSDARIRCDIVGPGIIQVALDSELIIEKDAVIDLGHEIDPNLDGQIECDGLLRLRDNATVMYAQVYVSRASVEDNAIILNSVVTAEAGAPYGQFFIEDNVQIWLDKITADGDRYLDLDPTQFDVNNIHVGIIDVNITEGVGGTQGGLFELRGKPDLVSGICDSNNEFLCKAAPGSIPNFDPNNWTINRLELVEGAKLNLTNRFDFQIPYDSGGDDEVLYVKELILRANSVLNTAFQHIYYEKLVIDPTARVVNIPLLGFSLVNIGFNDENEFLTRVKHNNYEHPSNSHYNRIHIQRIDGNEPDPGGMMLMHTLKDLDPQSPSYNQVINAQAKGIFAKTASVEDITIEFEYMFIEDPYGEAEIIVYLSDDPQVSRKLREVARIRPPAPGRPGSIGSGEFAVFSGTFSGGELNFIRGTYIELELRGREGTCCWINNWDPKVWCLAMCGDYDRSWDVTLYDYLVLLAEFGLSGPSGVGKGCLDLVPDGCIGPDDLMAWDISKVLNMCVFGEGLSASRETVIGKELASMPQLGMQNIGESELLICGKPSGIIGGNVPNNYLYDVDSSGVSTGDVNKTENDGRLIIGSDGIIYQISGNLGLIRLDTKTVVVGPSIIDDGNNLVWVGVNGEEGLWLHDAAFKPGDPNIVYIVPVVVDPQDGNCPYMATAKLQLTGGGNYDLLKLYGKNPAEESTRLPTKCSNVWNFLYDPDVYHLREVEVDPSGNHLFVLSSKLYCDPNNPNINDENNWILIYDEAIGNSSEVRVQLSDHNVIGPTAMVVSSLEEKVYLASSAAKPNGSNDLMTEVYCFSIDKIGQTVTGLTYDHHVDINCPFPDICYTHPSWCDTSLGFISAITSLAEDLGDGTLYVTGFTAPKFHEDVNLPFSSENAEFFTTPMLAALAPEAIEPVKAVNITGCDLALPLSLVWTGDKCAGADINANGVVNFPDFAFLALQWLQTSGTPSADIAPESGGDGLVNLLDLAVLADHWLKVGCN